jgi:glycine/D-amino acid oxidase-like deaminating enzyme
VQPAALVRGLADTLPENVTLYENSPVLAISGAEKPLLELADGEVRCEALFVAVNHEAPRLGFLQRRLTASTLSGSLTRVLTAEERASLGNLADWGVLSLHGGGATVRLTVDGRINLRNDAGFRAGRLLSAAELGKRQAIHRAAFERRFPDLKHVPFEYAWSGVEGLSRNGTNFFGRQHGNIFLAGGYNGSGVSRGTAFGAVLAEYAMGGQSPLLDDCLAVAPAAWIPPRPFLDLAAMAMVRARFRGVGLDR